ncbi:MAG: hypothetical protein U0175_29665 [Caldilineaceae bacterium]
MDTLSQIISILLWLFIGFPVCLVLHEMGHALMILLLTKQRVTFQFGVRGTQREIRLGRLTIHFYFEPGTFLGCRYHLEDVAALSKRQIFWITVGGPLASLLLAILCSVLWFTTNNIDTWRGLVVINLIAFLYSSIPGYYAKWMGAQAGIANDGLQVVQLFH